MDQFTFHQQLCECKRAGKESREVNRNEGHFKLNPSIIAVRAGGMVPGSRLPIVHFRTFHPFDDLEVSK